MNDVNKACSCPSGDGSLRHPCPAHSPRADVQPGGRVRLATVPYDRARDLLGDAYNAGTHGIGYSQQTMELHDAIIPAQPSPGGQDAREREGWRKMQKAAASQARKDGVGACDALYELAVKHGANDAEAAGFAHHVNGSLALLETQTHDGLHREAAMEAALAARQPVGETVTVPGAPTSCRHCDSTDLKWFAHVRTLNDVQQGRLNTHDVGCVFVLGCEECSETLRVVKADDIATLLNATPTAQAVDMGQFLPAVRMLVVSARTSGGTAGRDAHLCEALDRVEALLPKVDGQAVGRSFQAAVAEWMGQCFLPSLYSNMTERGDRLLEEVLELLQAHGYDKARIPTLVDYVFGRPVGDPAQEVGGVMVTLAGYCWVVGLDMHADGQAELDRINQPDVMARIRAKQEAKNALHFDTPLPGNAGAAVEEWPREGDLVRYGEGSSALAIRLGPHAGGWHGYQCCGGYSFFTKAHRPSRADMDTWLDCAKYRDERTKVADNRVAHEMYLLDNQAARNG